MRRINYILIPAVLVFSLFIGINASGTHDYVFSAGHPVDMSCEGPLCGLFPEVTCSVHCLTSGLVQSMDAPVVLTFSVAFIAVLVVLLLSSVMRPEHAFSLVEAYYRPPPDSFHLKTQKRE